MLTILLVEDNSNDLSFSTRVMLKTQTTVPLDLAILWLTESEVTDEQNAQYRQTFGVNKLFCLNRKSLTYKLLLEETTRIVQECETDVVIVDLNLGIPGIDFQLCGIGQDPLIGSYVLEGVQLTRDLEKTGLISYFIWLSNNVTEALTVNSGYMCEVIEGSVPLVNVPRVIAINKYLLNEKLPAAVKSLAKYSNQQLSEISALEKISQLELIKLYTENTERYSVEHWMNRTVAKGGKNVGECLRELKRELRRLSQVLLIAHTSPLCRLGSLLRAYDKPWLDDVVNHVKQSQEGVFEVDGERPKLNDEIKGAKFFGALTEGLKNWLFRIPLTEIPGMVNREMRISGDENASIVSNGNIKNAGGNLQFGARSCLVEIFINVFKNAREKGTEISCTMELKEKYLIITVKNRWTEKNKEFLTERGPFLNPRGLKVLQRCIGTLNYGANIAEDDERWWIEHAYRVDDKVERSESPNDSLLPLIKTEGITDQDVPEGFWLTRIYMPLASEVISR